MVIQKKKFHTLMNQRTIRIEWKLFFFRRSRLYSLKSHHAKVGIAIVGIEMMHRFSCSIETKKGPPLATIVDRFVELDILLFT